MGAKDCAPDNAVCESFFASLKKELTRRRSWPTRRELQTATFAWIEGWYNRSRLHSTLGYLSPADYEHNYTLTEGDRARSGIRRIARTCPPKRVRSRSTSSAHPPPAKARARTPPADA
jgi:hypothetical protein